jgi:CubicO group peptidase (beta-lactamase class C family)
MASLLTRRDALSLAVKTAIAAGSGALFPLEAMGADSGPNENDYARAFRALDSFVTKYMKERSAPGMMLALADREKILRPSTYGFSDLARRESIRPDQLFHIGSVSKSFTAIAILQMHEEGKLDLHKPITGYLPWLKIQSEFQPITAHHLLTHSAGLSSGPPVHLSDPAAKHRAAYAPGQYFHYSNLGYQILGYLISAVDGCPVAVAIRRRILDPLGMTRTEASVNSGILERTVESYAARRSDRHYPSNGVLIPASEIIFEAASGNIASNAQDMGLYVSMLSNRGKAGSRRILSEASFEMMVKPWIKAEDFGPKASYGYGLAIDSMDGRVIARHTGGMLSFMSSMHIDWEDGIGAFASINAMQEYRPVPVTEYAIRVLRATQEGRPLPDLPPPNSPDQITQSSDYAGTFVSPDGKRLEFLAENGRLFLIHEGVRVGLETTSEPGFLAAHPDFDRFLFTFGREHGDQGKVTEVFHGDHWYANGYYSGPKEFATPKEWDAFVGHYRNEDPWLGSIRIVIRKGKLWVLEATGSDMPLEQRDRDTFVLADSPHNPEWIQFLSLVDGRAEQLKYSGADFWRVDSR